jgi:hypothetical protein
MGIVVFSISTTVVKILNARVIDIISEVLNLIAAKYEIEMIEIIEVKDCKAKERKLIFCFVKNHISTSKYPIKLDIRFMVALKRKNGITAVKAS